jgi:hypothetical protein
MEQITVKLQYIELLELYDTPISYYYTLFETS